MPAGSSRILPEASVMPMGRWVMQPGERQVQENRVEPHECGPGQPGGIPAGLLSSTARSASQEKAFVEEGGLTERLYRVRSQRRIVGETRPLWVVVYHRVAVSTPG